MADLETKKVDGVLEVTLCRPETKNAVTVEMWEGLARAFVSADGDPEVRVVLLRGAGGNFCSGADLRGSSPAGATETRDEETGTVSAEARSLALMRRRIAPAAVALHRLRKPTLAMVDGIAAGAGCNLALGCDLVYAAEDARFSQIFVRRALSLDFGGAWLLPRLVGLQKAKELAFFGDFIDAPAALAAGLIAGVEPGDRLETRVRERATRLARQSPLALASIKASIERALELPFAEAVDEEFVLQARCTASEDFAEGVRAFLEKRPPRFVGR
jgi:2-(1,2-epoxy-1,2-dihydrophenyl)acetyl-CoA isomerase